MASFLTVAVFYFFYVPPRFSLAVSDVQYLMTFAVMLVVGLVTAKLTTGLHYQARVASRRERRVHALYEMSRELSGALLPQQIIEISEHFAKTEFKAKVALSLLNAHDRLVAPVTNSSDPLEIDMAIAHWAFDHASQAGCGTDTLPGSPILYVPLKAPMRTRGVMAIQTGDARRLMTPEQQQLLQTFARLIAISLERIHYVEVAQDTTVQMESERLRNSLLSALSHDLRTPLAVLAGLNDSLMIATPTPAGQQIELLQASREEVFRMTSLVNNLLDMARLQAGAVKLNLQWQPIEEVIGSSLRSMRPVLQRHHVQTNIADDVPLLNIDAVLIERVLSNLIENAVKYSPLGGLITIGARKVGADTAEVWIEDNGPGIAPGKEESIFNKFERGQKETNIPGVGLGLAICRAIIDAHGGSIRAEQVHSGGACFVFSLPVGIPPAIEAEADTPVAEKVNE